MCEHVLLVKIGRELGIVGVEGLLECFGGDGEGAHTSHASFVR
jgi:hypothetical protein